MPRCEGIPPDGRCPLNINNRTVKLTQGDLMLCPSCDGIRFPPHPSAGTTVRTNKKVTDSVSIGADNSKQPRKPQQSDRVATKCSDTRRPRSSVNIDKATDDDDDETATNDNCCTESKQIQSDDEEDCIFCNETTTVNSDSIRCDVCNHLYHQQCTGLPKEVFAVLVSIIEHTGLVCRQCRVQVWPEIFLCKSY